MLSLVRVVTLLAPVLHAVLLLLSLAPVAVALVLWLVADAPAAQLLQRDYSKWRCYFEMSICFYSGYGLPVFLIRHLPS